MVVIALLVTLIVIFDCLVFAWWHLSRKGKPLPANDYKEFCTKHSLKVRFVGYAMATMALMISAFCYFTWYGFSRTGASDQAFLILGSCFGFAATDLYLAVFVNQKYQVFEES